MESVIGSLYSRQRKCARYIENRSLGNSITFRTIEDNFGVAEITMGLERFEHGLGRMKRCFVRSQRQGASLQHLIRLYSDYLRSG